MTSATDNVKRGTIFSRMRPTGLLRLGNYVGALQQDYDCIYCAVDVHALTTVESRSDTEVIQSNTDDMVLDWLAAGIEEVYEKMGLA